MTKRALDSSTGMVDAINARTWAPDSWRQYESVQMATYEDKAEYEKVMAKLSKLPPLVHPAGEPRGIRPPTAFRSGLGRALQPAQIVQLQSRYGLPPSLPCWTRTGSAGSGSQRRQCRQCSRSREGSAASADSSVAVEAPTATTGGRAFESPENFESLTEG